MASDTYFVEIEGHFAQRRGTPFILSAKDWLLMKKWREEGIPLPVVIEAIDTVFTNNETSGRKKVISSLTYCRHAVKEIWDERRELYAGAHDVLPESDPLALLSLLAAELEASPLGAPFADRVRALASEKSVPAIEGKLLELEGELIDAVIAASPDGIAEIRAHVAAALAGSKAMDEKTRARTEAANLRRLAREKFGLPRLSLFS
jgi:hypothetical protein